MLQKIKGNKAKKIIKTIGWTFVAIVSAVCILFIGTLWYLNSKNLAPVAMRIANEHIDGNLTLRDLRLSLRKGIFMVGVEADSMKVISHAFKSLTKTERGETPEYADSLLTLDHLQGALDLKSLLLKNEISLRDVELTGLSVNLVVAHNGKSNYEILRLKSDTIKKKKKKAPSFRLNQFSLKQPKEIRFYNAADSTSASALLLTDAAVDGHDQPTYRLKINGNVTSPKATLLTNLSQISFGLNGNLHWDPALPGLVAMDRMELRGAFLKAIISGEIDLTDNPIIKKCDVTLKPVAVSNMLRMLTDSTRRANRLLPPDFFTDATVEGRFVLTHPMNLTIDTFPSAEIDITIPPSTLRHGSTQLSNIALKAKIKTHTNLPDSTSIDIKRFSMQGPGTEFQASATITKPISDPTFVAKLKGKVDFKDLPEIAMSKFPGYLSGKIKTDLQAEGSISLLKPDRLNQLIADGNLTANDIYFISADTTKMVQIGHASVGLSSQPSNSEKRHLSTKLEVDTATVLVSGIDLTFGGVALNAAVPEYNGNLKVKRFNIATLKDGSGARISNITGQIGTKGRFESGRIPELTADLNVGSVSAGTKTDRILMTDTKILAWLDKVSAGGQSANTSNGKTTNHKIQGNKAKSITPRKSGYLSPSEVRKYVLKKRSHGKHIKRVYSEAGANDEEILVWNLNDHFRKFLNEWKVKGSLKTRKANLLTPLFPISNRMTAVDIRFNNDTVNISDITLMAGKSDITISGLVTNVRRALTSDQDNNLKGNLAVRSDFIDINELSSAVFSGTSYESDKHHGKKHELNSKNDKELAASLDQLSKEGPSKSSPLLIPVNVDARLSLKANNLLYSDLRMKNAGGDILVYDGGVNIHNMNAVSDAGALSFNALYAAPKATDMQFGFGLEAKDFNIGKFAKLIPALDSITPLLHDFSGMVGADIAATCSLDSGMNINLPTLNAAVRISGEDLAFIDPEKYRILGKWLGFKDKSDNTIHHLNVEITVEDGLLRVYPFSFNIDRYRLGAYGSNNINMDFDYHLSVLKSPLPFKFGITVKGNPKKYKVRLGGAKFNENTAIESVDMVRNARINLLDQIQDVFRRGVRNSRFAKVSVTVPSGFDDNDTELSESDSIQLIREGIIDGNALMKEKVPAKEEKKKRKRFLFF